MFAFSTAVFSVIMLRVISETNSNNFKKSQTVSSKVPLKVNSICIGAPTLDGIYVYVWSHSRGHSQRLVSSRQQ